MAQYYISTAGSDTNDGLTTATPWQTLSKVNGFTFAPGDIISFNGGQAWTGTGSAPALTIAQSGSSGSPITINSYGTGQATINGGNSQAIYAANRSYVTVKNVNATSTPPNSADAGGNQSGTIAFNATTTNSTAYPGITVTNCTVSGGTAGIYCHFSQTTSDGFPGINISSNTVTTATEFGIAVCCGLRGSYGAGSGFYQNIGAYVAKNLVYNIGATPAYPANGIQFSAGDATAIVELNTVHDIGANLTSTSGGVGGSTGNAGIQLNFCRSTALRFNEAYNVKAPAGCIDGAGVDLDTYSNSCLMYGNFAHDNDGSGLIISSAAAGSGINNHIAFNVAVNNCKTRYTSGDAQIRVDGPTGNTTYVYNNTVIANPPMQYNYNLVGIGGTAIADTHIGNNYISISQGYAVSTVAGTTVAGNVYSVGSGSFNVFYNGATYTTLAGFQGANVKNENGTGSIANGLLASPVAPVTTGGATNLKTLLNYRPISTSPLLGAALNVATLWGITIPPTDAAGSTLPASGYAVGAFNTTSPLLHNAYDTAVLNDFPQFYFPHRITTGTTETNMGMQGGVATIDTTAVFDQGALFNGQNSSGIKFNGGAVGVSIGGGYQPVNHLTFAYECWITPTSVTGTQALCNIGNGATNTYFQVQLVNGQITGVMGNNNGTVFTEYAATLTAGQTYHVVAQLIPPTTGTWYGGVTNQNGSTYPQWKFYINAVAGLYGTSSLGNPPYSSNAIGGSTATLAQGVIGVVSREAVYFPALPASEVTAHYNIGLTTPNSTPSNPAANVSNSTSGGRSASLSTGNTRARGTTVTLSTGNTRVLTTAVALSTGNASR